MTIDGVGKWPVKVLEKNAYTASNWYGGRSLGSLKLSRRPVMRGIEGEVVFQSEYKS
jgi:hypothetical protein